MQFAQRIEAHVVSGAMKNAVPKTFLRTVIGGHRYSRGPNDLIPPQTPTLNAPVPAATSMAVNWVNGIDADTGIQAAYAESSPNGANNWTRITVNYQATPNDSTVFTGLTPGSPYDFRIANIDNAVPPNTSAYTPIQTASTLGVNPALEPGVVSIVDTNVVVIEGNEVSIAVQRVGGGTLSPAIEADWNVTGLSEGGPTPANGTIAWAAGENGIKSIVTQAGGVTINQTGTLAIVALRQLTGNITPTLGTPSSVDFTIQQASGQGLKWNPGFYMGTNNLTFPNDRHLSDQIIEQNLVLSSGPRVLGWKGFYYPSCLQGATLGLYDFSKITRDLNKLRSMSTPKRLMMTIIPQLFNNTSFADLLPAAVYNNSSFGPAYKYNPATGTSDVVAGKFGYTTMNGGKSLTIAWWRPAVMNWIIDLFSALAAYVNPGTGIKLDQDPYLEQTSFGELSMGVDPGTDWTAQGPITQYQRLIAAINGTWGNTVHMCNNNYPATQALAQTLTNFCISNRTPVGGPDIQPVLNSSSNGLSWGQRAVLGIAQPAPVDMNFVGPDQRDIASTMADIQGPELQGGGNNSAFTPYTLYLAADQTLHQSHIVFTCLSIGANNPPIPAYPGTGKNTGTNPGNWNSVLQVINGNTISHPQKPSSIP